MAVPSLTLGGASLRVIAESALWAGLDLLFPPACQNCRQMGERFCLRCRAQIEYLVGPLCQQCGYPQLAPTTECEQCRRIPFSGQGIRSLAFHSGPLRQAIHGLKYRRNPPLSQTLAR